MKEKKLECVDCWKVVNKQVTAKIPLDDHQMPLPLTDDVIAKLKWTPIRQSVAGSFVDDKLCLSETTAKNSARGYNSKYGVKKEFRTKPHTYSSHSPNAIMGGYEPVKCKLFLLPEDEVADTCTSYEEYKLKCTIMNKIPQLSEIEFNIYTYKSE